MFFNTLSADGKYPFQYCENLQLPIQMEVSKKRKSFSEFFVLLLEFISNFKHFETKMMVIANLFPKLQTVKNFATLLCKNLCFWTPLESEHVKVSRIIAKSPWECFYHVFSAARRKLISKMSPLVLGEI